MCAAAAVSLIGCHPVAAKSSRPVDFITPNPDVPSNSTTTKTNGLAGGPALHKPADVRDPAAGRTL